MAEYPRSDGHFKADPGIGHEEFQSQTLGTLAHVQAQAEHLHTLATSLSCTVLYAWHTSNIPRGA